MRNGLLGNFGGSPSRWGVSFILLQTCGQVGFLSLILLGSIALFGYMIKLGLLDKRYLFKCLIIRLVLHCTFCLLLETASNDTRIYDPGIRRF